MTSEFQQITLVIHYGFKNVQNVIEITLKLLFFAAKLQKLPGGWALCSQASQL